MPPTQSPEAPGSDAQASFLRPGRVLFSRYVLERLLGRGTIGEVWQVHDRNLDRSVALKILAEACYHDPEARDALKRETRRSVELAHPNIVRVHDFAEDGESGGIALEYIDGATLTELRLEHRQGCLEVGGFDAWVAELCRAIDHAHSSAEIVHGDLKPANLLISSSGALKVVDFGLGCALRRRIGHAPEGSDSLAYMSPQQHRGEAPTAADDIYTIGAILYEALTSRPPIHSGDISEQVHETIPETMADRRQRLGVVGEPIPPHWEETILACLERDPQNRPSSAAEICRRLDLDWTAPPQPGTAHGSAAVIELVPSRISPREWLAAVLDVLIPKLAILREWLRQRRSLVPGALVVAAGMVVLTTFWPRDDTPSAPYVRRTREPAIPAYAITVPPGASISGASPGQFGGLSIRTEPPGAAVTIDGQRSEVAPVTIKDLAPGNHVVAMQLVGFDKATLPASVQPGLVTDLGTIALRRSSGTLQVTTDPPGARILLGDRELGRTPLTVKLSSGSYQAITAQLDGYVATTFDATVPPDETVALAPMMLKPEQPRLAISSEPAGLHYELYSGSSSPPGAQAISSGISPATVDDLRPGVYRVVFGEGARAQSMTVTVGERGTTPLHRAFPVGTVKIESTPSGAEVMEGEQSLGVTPLQLTLLEGPHTFTADLKDRTAKPRTVRVAKGETQSIRFDFTPSTTTARAPRSHKPKKKVEESTFTKIGRSIKNIFD